MRSKSVGKVLHRLTQRRHPWQMSKMRPISATIFGSSQYSGFFQSIGWRVGASRLPSRVVKGLVGERVERLLEAVGVGALGLGERLEPVGDLVEAFAARGFGHAGIHVGVLVGL